MIFFSECSPLAEISGGQYFGDWRTNHTSNTTVRFGCYKGYNLNGSDGITCDTNGSWTPFPKCTAKRKFKDYPVLNHFYNCILAILSM